MITNNLKPLLFITYFTFSTLSYSFVLAEDSEKDLTSWNKWHQEYEQSLTEKSGWLSLVGLYWLTEGINTLGAANNNIHILPRNAPDYLGYVEVNGDQVSFVKNSDSTKQLLSVKDRTVVAFGNFEFYIIKREKGFAVRLAENNPKKIKAFEGTKYITFSSDWIIPAKLILNAEPKTLMIPTVYGTIREQNSAGWLEFKVNGTKQKLEAVDYGKETPLYVMFSDKSSGRTTYGAGRYIEVEWPDKKGNTLIDFNRAYNPPCAFTDFATCPLTPKQNRLKVEIKAGELYVNHDQ